MCNVGLVLAFSSSAVVAMYITQWNCSSGIAYFVCNILTKGNPMIVVHQQRQGDCDKQLHYVEPCRARRQNARFRLKSSQNLIYVTSSEQI